MGRSIFGAVVAMEKWVFWKYQDLNVPTLATHLSSLGKTFVKGAIGQEMEILILVVLADDGTVFGFGENSDGQLGD